MLHVERNSSRFFLRALAPQRVTFEVGIQSMGGSVFSSTHASVRSLGHANPLPMSRGISSGWCKASSPACTSSASSKKWPRTPNFPHHALSDKFHPCQRWLFLHARRKFGALRGSSSPTSARQTRMQSLIYLAARLGVISASHSHGYAPSPLKSSPEWQACGPRNESQIEVLTDRARRQRGDGRLYGIVTSMGFEPEEKCA